MLFLRRAAIPADRWRQKSFLNKLEWKLVLDTVFLKGYLYLPMSHCYILFKAVSAEWAILIQSRIRGRLAEKNGSFKNNLVIHGNKHCRRKYYSAWRQNVAH